MIRSIYLTDLMRIFHSVRKIFGVHAYFGRLAMPDRGPGFRSPRMQLAWRHPEGLPLGGVRKEGARGRVRGLGRLEGYV